MMEALTTRYGPRRVVWGKIFFLENLTHNGPEADGTGSKTEDWKAVITIAWVPGPGTYRL